MCQFRKRRIDPDMTLEKACEAAGASVRPLWRMQDPGPGVAWVCCHCINGVVVMVQTYQRGGWEAFMPSRGADAAGTVAEVLARCGGGAP